LEFFRSRENQTISAITLTLLKHDINQREQFRKKRNGKKQTLNENKDLNGCTQKFHHPCNNQIQQNQNSPKKRYSKKKKLEKNLHSSCLPSPNKSKNITNMYR
jgi:hypothetical protein